jgi:polyribonucleotide nucleotidyltransferase
LKQTFEIPLNGGSFRVETGAVAQQANGSAMVFYSGLALLATAVTAKQPREGVDFFPLMVDYEEKMYAAGKFPGGFFKREGRPSEDAVLTARRIDRPIRPLFPDYYRNDVQIIVTALSSDRENVPDVFAINAACIALLISDIPFPTPIAAVRVGRVNGEFVLYPTFKQLEEGDLNLLVAGTENRVNMIETEAKQVPEQVIAAGIELTQDEIRRLIGEFKKIERAVGKPKMEFPPAPEPNADLVAMVRDFLIPRLEEFYPQTQKQVLEKVLDEMKNETVEYVARTAGEDRFTPDELAFVPAIFENEVDKFARRKTFDTGVRIDGRKPDEIRPIQGEVGILPRVHGSGLFTRGQTQVLSSVTLGTFSDQQIIDSLNLDASKRYMHHYNFPPYSVGEVKPLRGAGRREIGHGALAEKALLCVIPDEEKFPYSIRVVSEVLESNASSSMASVCGSTLALMDAGVPIETAVAGISIGLLTEGEKYVLLTDISGFEDHYGDMDFKVAGSSTGVTAIQLDVKIEGLTTQMLKETLARARTARLFILDQLAQVIARPREQISEYAPLLTTLKINPDKIGLVIGPSGKNIKKIVADTETTIDIDDDGTVYIAGLKKDGVDAAVKIIRDLTMDIEEGAIFSGKVVRITPFGAFIELVPGKDGLLHISQVADHHIDKVEDVLKMGDTVLVQVRAIDENGKINLIRKDIEYRRPQPEHQGRERRDRRERRPSGGRSGPPRRGGGGPPRRPPRS